VDRLLEVVNDRLHAGHRQTTVLVPFERGDLLAALHREGEVTREVAGEGGLLVDVRLDDATRARFSPYLVDVDG
jgi:GTP-binding protein HflX